MGKNILLIEPPYLDLYGKKKAMVKPYFPLGLGYIASVLKKDGHNVNLLILKNLMDIEEQVLKSINNVKPDLIGLTSMTPNFPRALNISMIIKKNFNIPIVIGGQHVSAFKEKILFEYKEFDFVIFGEGEDTIIELVKNIDNKDFKGINGLVWRNDNKVICNQIRELRMDLDGLPYPARDLVDLQEFSTHSHIAGGKSATIITSRGCPFGCIFCSAHTVDGRKYRTYSISYIMNEIDELINKYKVNYIFIQDDTFTLQKKRVIEICTEIIKRKYKKIRFGCFSRTDIIDNEMAFLLKKAGFVNIVFGIESGDEEVLIKIGKKSNIEKAKSAIKICNKNNLKTTASFVIGLPFDTKESINKTIKLAFQLKPTLVTFNPLVPFPGSEIFDYNIHMPKTVMGWEKYVTTDIPPFSFINGVTPEDIYKIASKAHRKFYFRPIQVFRILKTIRSITDIKDYFVAALSLFIK